SLTPPGVDRAGLDARRAELGPIWTALAITTAVARSEPRPELPPPPLDRSSPGAFLRSAVAGALADPRANVRAFADEVAPLRRDEPSAIGRRALAAAEIPLLGLDARPDPERVRTPGLWLLREEPRWPSPPGTSLTMNGTWDVVANTFNRRVGMGAIARVGAAWYPDEADTW